MDETNETHWSIPNLIDMLRRSDDAVAAYMIAYNVISPGELRACAAPLGVAHIDTLRDLTLAVVIAARALDDTDTAALTDWVRMYRSRDRASAVGAYLISKGRTRSNR